MKALRHKAFAVAALLAGFVFAAPPAVQAQTELKFGHVGSPGSLFAVSSEEFARRVNEKLAGRYKVVVYGSSQLGDDTEMLQKIKAGTIDFALPSTVMSSVVPGFGLFEMPYLVKDREHMKRIEKEVGWAVLAPQGGKPGYNVLAVWENGFRHIPNKKRPIKTPEDLKGIKLRVPQGEWRVKMFQLYGANPSAMGLSEVFAALQTGTMDGQENPLTQTYTSKFQEVQKFLSLTGHVYTPAYPVMSPRKFNALPPDVQKVLVDTAREVQAFVYEQAEKMDNELLDKMKSAGMQVNEADKNAFIAASKPAYEEFAQEVQEGKKMIDIALQLGQ
nr:MAG: C4-dicarboxylate ABC transporter [Pseudomonadota bacterium]